MKQIRILHKWIGIIVGAFLLILCLSGACIALAKVADLQGPLWGWIKHFHASLQLGQSGNIIMGIASLLTVIEVITGYILWGNMARHGLCRALKWNYPNRLMGLHNGAGVWAGIPLLLMATTGTIWCFHWADDLMPIIQLHVGGWAELPSRLLWLAAALLAATLPITGLLITLRRR